MRVRRQVEATHEPEKPSQGFKASRDGVCPILERFEFMGIASGFMVPMRDSKVVEATHEPPQGREVLECAPDLSGALWRGQSGRVESARGLAQSKALARGRWFMGSKRELSVGGILTPALGPQLRLCPVPTASTGFRHDPEMSFAKNELVEPRGVEPLTFSLRTRRSAN